MKAPVAEVSKDPGDVNVGRSSGVMSTADRARREKRWPQPEKRDEEAEEEVADVEGGGAAD